MYGKYLECNYMNNVKGGMNMKENMMKLVLAVILVAICFVNSGCVSYAVYQGSKRQVALKKAVVSGNDAAIKAIRLGDDGVGLGIDVMNLEALGERPWLQLGAAVLDLGMLYGGYKGVEALDSGSSSDQGHGGNTSGGDTIIIDGDGNTINTGDTSTGLPETLTF